MEADLAQEPFALSFLFLPANQKARNFTCTVILNRKHSSDSLVAESQCQRHHGVCQGDGPPQRVSSSWPPSGSTVQRTAKKCGDIYSLAAHHCLDLNVEVSLMHISLMQTSNLISTPVRELVNRNGKSASTVLKRRMRPLQSRSKLTYSYLCGI